MSNCPNIEPVINAVKKALQCGCLSLLPTVVFFGLGIGAIQAQPNPPGTNLASVLGERNLWGKDFPLVLLSLPNWNQIGDRRVAVFSNRIVSAVSHKTRDEAQQSIRKLDVLLAAAPSVEANAALAPLLKGVSLKQPVRLRAEIVSPFIDDDSIRIAITRPGAQFLSPNLTVAEVRKRLGTAEKITQEVQQNPTERRPVVLTLHHYANDAVVFAEADIAPKPGLVDRVILDVPTITTALFKEVR